MLKQLAAAVACASMLALLIGVIHYESPVGSNIEKVQQHSKGCPPGQHWSGGECRKV
jgi:hypothetical protein